jgi:hypothetical protein
MIEVSHGLEPDLEFAAVATRLNSLRKMLGFLRNVPQGLKPGVNLAAIAARLKSRLFT